MIALLVSWVVIMLPPMSDKRIESIWAGDVVQWLLPTERAGDNPLPAPGALKAWAIDAGLRDGSKIVLHHVAGVGPTVVRPDGKKDCAIGVRRTTKTRDLTGYAVVPVPTWAILTLPADVEAPGPTAEWVTRRALSVASNEEIAKATLAKSDDATIVTTAPDGTVHHLSSDASMEDIAKAVGGTVCGDKSPFVVGPPGSSIQIVVGESLEAQKETYAIPDGATICGHAIPAGDLPAEQVAQACGGKVVNGGAVEFPKVEDPSSAPMPTVDDVSVPNDSDVDTTNNTMFVALDNANQRLHADTSRLQHDASLLQCLGRLRGVIEAKTGITYDGDERDVVAMTRTMVAALMAHTPAKVWLSSKNELVALRDAVTSTETKTNIASAVERSVKEQPTLGSDEWVNRAAALDDASKALVQDLDGTPRG